ncbi:MAG: winged helix-turn-helix domain-containing protein [Lautropia sp.]
MDNRIQFRLRLMHGDTIALGPGKVAVLEAIVETGSINAAAKRLGMSYRRTWQLVDAMNRAFRKPLVRTAIGGSHGGGTVVTEAGQRVIELYRRVEMNAKRASSDELRTLTGMMADRVAPPSARDADAD